MRLSLIRTPQVLAFFVRSEHLSAKGFSLVEVTLALGVVAFALVAVLGLFGSSLRAAKESHEDTKLADIAVTIANMLREDPSTVPSQLEFDYDGNPTTKVGAGPAYFQATLATSSPTLNRKGMSHVEYVRCTLSYPIDATSPTQKLFHISKPVTSTSSP